MKVIFLDFNGVLDTWDEMDEINYDNLERLKKISLDTEAKIVISSSLKNSYWYTGKMSKMLTILVTQLTDAGLEVIGYTPIAENRESEILAYLNNHPEIEDYVILDDDYDMPLLKEHLVKLPCQNVGPSQKGLQDEHMRQAIQILNKSSQNEKNSYTYQVKTISKRSFQK